MNAMSKPTSVDDYIEGAPDEARPHLTELRRIVRAAAPDASEKISYGMPTYDIAGRRLLHIAAAKKHVAVYALVHVDAAVPPELARYVDHRSTLQFRFDQPLPEQALAAQIGRKLAAIQAGAASGDD
jgi:uncharacterized protein YdhG (YjbR/CyaY superfamily)